MGETREMPRLVGWLLGSAARRRQLHASAILVLLAATGRLAGAQGGRFPRGTPAVAPESAGSVGAVAAAPSPNGRLNAIVQQRLQLTDPQTGQLRQTSRRFAAERRSLLRREHEARRVLRIEMRRGAFADQDAVQQSLDQLYLLQQQRSELAVREQRELSGFLSPMQRAEYAGLQERAFRAAQDIRRRRELAGDTLRPGGGRSRVRGGRRSPPPR